MSKWFGLFDYNKEGPGVYVDDPPKGPFVTFFSIVARKFWKIATINMLYVIFSIPALFIAVFLGSYLFPDVIPLLQLDTLEKILGTQSGDGLTSKQLAAFLFIQISVVLSMLLTGIQIIVMGPVHAGITRLLRNYAREEHAFIWGDFKDTVRSKWKIAAVSSIIGVVSFLVITTGYTFYKDPAMIPNEFVRGILSGFIIIIFLLFSMMQMYLYPMMVTFNMTLKQLYKNSFYLTMAKLPFNFAVLLATIFLLAVIPMIIMLLWVGIGLVISLFYYFFVGFGLNLMLTNFYVYRQIKRFIIDPIKIDPIKNETEQSLADEGNKTE